MSRRLVIVVRLFAIAVFSLMIIASLPTTARAITYGTVDSEHTFVGTVAIGYPRTDVPYQISLWQWCSGSLIAPKVFLSAGHCVADLAVYFPGFTPEAGLIWVTFAPSLFLAPADRFYQIERMEAHPDYYWGPMSDPHDVGVFILGDAVPGSPLLGQLPPHVNYLDELQADGAVGWLKDPVFANVGYGSTLGTGPYATRLISYSGFLSLHNAWVYLSMNIHTGNGGTCYGDSGGPTLIAHGGAEYIVAVTSWGDVPCKATNINYRVDTESSLTWIESIVSAEV